MAAFQLLTPELAGNVTTTEILMTEAATAGEVITTAGAKVAVTVSGVEIAGILLDDVANGKYGLVIKPGSLVDVTPVLIKGGILIHAGAGDVKYADEVAAGDVLRIIAFCTSTTQIQMFIHDPGITV